MNNICLAFTGASGLPYGLRLLECLLQQSCRVYLLISQAAQVVSVHEGPIKLTGSTAQIQQQLLAHFQADTEQLQVLGNQQWTAPLASGSANINSMVVCPCSSGCLSAIATGASNNLIERAADVMLKEQRQLILVHREMPVSAIHLENMLKLARIGVTIMPASPGFYHQPKTVNDVIDFVVARILDHLGMDQDLIERWGD